MKKKLAVLSLIYSLGQISTGLILHPYQTMQSLVREKLFVWMSLLPSFILIIITLIWKIAVVPLTRLFFSCSLAGVFNCGWLGIVSNFITFYCIYWQLLIFYLLLRFSLAFRKN